MSTPKIDETTVAPRTLALALELYKAYTANSDNLNFQGAPCPAWPNLTPAVRSHWCASATMAIRLLVEPEPALVQVDEHVEGEGPSGMG